MKNLRRIIAVIIAVCICFTLLPMNLLHAEDEAGFNFTVYYHNTIDGSVKEVSTIDASRGFDTIPLSECAWDIDEENYSFTGWNTKSDGNGINYGEYEEVNPYFPNKDKRSLDNANMDDDKTEMHLYAQFKVKELNINFFHKDGSVYYLMGSIHDDGETIHLPDLADLNYSVPGKKLVGWTKDKNSDVADFVLPYETTREEMKGIIDLYAVFKDAEDVKVDKVVYHYKDKTISNSSNSVLDFSEAGFDVPDLEFVGWSTDENYYNYDSIDYNNIYSKGDVVNAIPHLTNEIHLYAVFENYDQEYSYSIVYHSNGATEGKAPTDETSYLTDFRFDNDILIKSSGDLKKSGYEFTGWNTKEDGSGREFYEFDTFIRFNKYYDFWNIAIQHPFELHLYAQWEKDNQLTFHANGADGIVPQSVIIDYDILMPEASTLSKEGKIFRYWCSSEDGFGDIYYANKLYTRNEVAPNENLYAIFDKYYTVTYDLNNPNLDFKVPVDHHRYIKGVGVSVLYSDQFHKSDDYSFLGWCDDRDGNGELFYETRYMDFNKDSDFSIDGDTKLYAQWEKKNETSFTISYDCGDLKDSVACPVDENKYQSMDAVKIQDLSFDQQVVKKNGETYFFDGWESSHYPYFETGNTVYGGEIISFNNISLDEEIKLTAKWSVRDSTEYRKVMFEANLPNKNDIVRFMPYNEQYYSWEINVDTSFELKRNHKLEYACPQIDGYVFKEWNTKADATGEAYLFGDRIKINDNVIKLYAIWEPVKSENTLYVTFHFGDNKKVVPLQRNSKIYLQDLMTYLSKTMDINYFKSLSFIDKTGKDWLEDGDNFDLSTIKENKIDINIQAHYVKYDVTYASSEHGRLENVKLDPTEYNFSKLDSIPDPIPDDGYQFKGWILEPTITAGLPAFASLDDQGEDVINSYRDYRNLFVKPDDLQDLLISSATFYNDVSVRPINKLRIIAIFEPIVKTEATIEYYYDGILDDSKIEKLKDQIAGSTINTYPDKAGTDYKLDKSENLPLILDKDASKNVIKVYYVKIGSPDQPVTPDEPDTPNNPDTPAIEEPTPPSISDPNTPNKPNQSTPSPKPVEANKVISNKGVNTGDTTLLGTWIAGSLASLLCVILIIIRLRKKTEV